MTNHNVVVVHGQIYGRFMGCNVNGFFSLYKVCEERNRFQYNPKNGQKFRGKQSIQEM